MDFKKVLLGIGIGAGIASTMAFSYFTYITKKKRIINDLKKQSEQLLQTFYGDTEKAAIPDFESYGETEKYFFHQMEMGKLSILKGNNETGVDHIINALNVCTQVSAIMPILKNALPAKAYDLLLKKLAENQAQVGTAQPI